MKSRCCAKLADRSPCRREAAWWFLVGAYAGPPPLVVGKIEPLCGTHANQRERAGAIVRKVATCDGHAIGQARA